ncbi:uncharacterized protein TNCT_477031 [Trichonephila clavata]|uniref:Uncharacterized protein n=1 Tax=Trichonephila clavata TaxID=2740835 RepID=A0A8X6H259_TRICU|nr:uncharacterized protein TNCT_477031 [Trichonephila clavata]
MGIIHSFQWFVLILATVQAQYDYYSDELNAEEEYEEPIDPDRAKEFICTQGKDPLINCFKVMNFNVLHKNKIIECNEEVGFTGDTVEEVFEQSCRPETPIDVVRRWRNCKNRKLVLNKNLEITTLVSSENF